MTPTSSDTSNDKNFGEVLGGIAGEIAGGVANNVEENIQHVIDGTEIVVNGTENAIDGAGNIMNSIVNGVTGGTSSDNNPGGIGGDSPIDSDTGGITFDGTKISGCKVFGDEDSQTWKIVNWIVHLLIYGIPILVVLLGIVDFLGVVFSGEEDKMKEAQKKVIMRLVVGIVFLFVPSILKFIIDISGTFTGVASSDLFCGFI